eukprot:SAG31_NODE_33802_length_340_cov_0.618257_2_plen_49_part_01
MGRREAAELELESFRARAMRLFERQQKHVAHGSNLGPPGEEDENTSAAP